MSKYKYWIDLDKTSHRFFFVMVPLISLMILGILSNFLSQYYKIRVAFAIIPLFSYLVFAVIKITNHDAKVTTNTIFNKTKNSYGYRNAPHLNKRYYLNVKFKIFKPIKNIRWPYYDD